MPQAVRTIAEKYAESQSEPVKAAVRSGSRAKLSTVEPESNFLLLNCNDDACPLAGVDRAELDFLGVAG